MEELILEIYTLICINDKRYRKSWKEFNELKNTDQNYCYSNYYDVNADKYKVKCGTSLRFWENKSWINSIDPYGWFQCYFRYWFRYKIFRLEKTNCKMERNL